MSFLSTFKIKHATHFTSEELKGIEYEFKNLPLQQQEKLSKYAAANYDKALADYEQIKDHKKESFKDRSMFGVMTLASVMLCTGSLFAMGHGMLDTLYAMEAFALPFIASVFSGGHLLDSLRKNYYEQEYISKHPIKDLKQEIKATNLKRTEIVYKATRLNGEIEQAPIDVTEQVALEQPIDINQQPALEQPVDINQQMALEEPENAINQPTEDLRK